jgi:Cu2+-exporting ATPase
MKVIRQNVVWAFAYNLLVLPLAFAGALTPWAAAIGMSASSLIVVLNALRLQEFRRESASRAGMPIPRPVAA